MKFVIDVRHNITSSEWEEMSGIFDERSRAKKVWQIQDANSRLGWTKYRIRDILPQDENDTLRVLDEMMEDHLRYDKS